MCGQEAALRHPKFMRDRCFEVLDQGIGCIGRICDAEQCACTQNRLTQIFALIRREVEEIGIIAHCCAFREERRNERRLTVHVAFGRNCEQAVRAITEVCCGNCLRAALNIGVVLGKITELFDGFDDFRIVKLHLVRHPLVINRRLLCAQHQVFDPVRRRPTSCSTRTQTNAPRCAAVCNDLIGQLFQFFHGFGNVVSRFVKRGRRIPNQRFKVDAVEHAVQLIVAIGVGICAQIHPRATRSEVFFDPIRCAFRHRRQEALLGQISRQTRLRENSDVRCRTGTRRDYNVLLEAVGTGVVHGRACGFFEIVQDDIDLFLFDAGPRTGHCDRLTFKVVRISDGRKAIPVKGAFTFVKRQMASGMCATSDQSSGSCCPQQSFHHSCCPPKNHRFEESFQSFSKRFDKSKTVARQSNCQWPKYSFYQTLMLQCS